MKSMTVSEARNCLPSLLDQISRVEEGIVITRHGRPLAKILPFREKKKTAKYPLRGMAVKIAKDFDQPISGLWEAVDS